MIIKHFNSPSTQKKMMNLILLSKKNKDGQLGESNGWKTT